MRSIFWITLKGIKLAVCIAVSGLALAAEVASTGDEPDHYSRTGHAHNADHTGFEESPAAQPNHFSRTGHAHNADHSAFDGSEDETRIGSGRYSMPVNAPFGQRGFGMRRDPWTGKSRMHYGQDFPAEYGSKVVAASGGVVDAVITGCVNWSQNRTQRKCGGGFGNHVRIRHPDGNYTYYAHMKSCSALKNLRIGQQVSEGQQIGCVGSSGSSTGAHLHFEVRGNRNKSSALDPKTYLR